MKKTEKTEYTKERILSAALDVFGTKGYAAATINDICNMGISKGLLYHNFDGKDDIYLCCLERSFSKLTNYIRAQETGSNPALYMEARLAFFKQNTKDARLFFEAVLQPPEHLKEKVRIIRDDFDHLNCILYQLALDSITLRSGITMEDAMSYFTLLQNMLNGYFSSSSFQHMDFTDIISLHETNLSKLLDFMFYGIAERGETH